MTEFTLVGGGLAGFSLAESLVDGGAPAENIRIVDADRPERASDNPTALFHPFPGRSLEPVPRKMRLVEATLDRIASWREGLDDPPIRETTMVRPIRDDHLARRLRDTWAGESGYPAWFDGRRVGADALAEYGDHLRGYDSGFVYRPAYTVDLGDLTSALAEQLAAAGVSIDRPREVRSLRRDGAGWRVESDDGVWETEQVVLALGAVLDDWFGELAMDSRGGELMHLPELEADRLGHVVNASGHVAPHPRGGIVAGASWWDPEDFQSRDDEAAIRDILDRCERLYPPIGESETRIVWRGVRAIFGDHQPLVGEVPGLDGAHVFGAFGSKGLLRIPLHAAEFADQLLGKPASVPELSKANRMGADKWRPDPERILVGTQE